MLLLALACAAPSERLSDTPMPDFSLTDTNPDSATYGEERSVKAERGGVSLWYFAHADCDYCIEQFEFLESLQDDLGGAAVLGVNEASMADISTLLTDDRTLPLLQDTEDADAWGLWEAAYSELWVLDAEGYPAAVFDLVYRDLALPGNRDELTEAVEALSEE